MNNLVKTLINRMSRVSGTVLTETHMRVLDYTYRYYEANRVGPLYQNIKRHTGVTRQELTELFPHGLNSVYTWVGIPIQTRDQVCKPLAIVNPDQQRLVYLDYNATTPLRPEVVQHLKRYQRDSYNQGNPSSSTNIGTQAYDLIHTARRHIADTLKVSPDEIVFTGGGSEADNLALKGIAFQYLDSKGHIITTRVEHPAVLKTVAWLESLGFDITYLDVDHQGHLDPAQVQAALRSNTILVAVMAANNEIGTIYPLAEIGAICRRAGVPFMVDAVQGFGKIPLDPKAMGISLLSLSAHKIYGPKGVGALFIDETISLTPLIHGGGQEFGLRAGTENVGSIMAFGLAARLAHREMQTEATRLCALQHYFLDGLRRLEPNLIVNGSLNNRLTNNLNIGLPGVDSGSLLLSLNHIGVYVSAGSACSAGSKEASHVIRALGVDTERYGIIRFGFGLQTSEKDLDYVLQYLPEILQQLRTETVPA